MTTGSRWLRAMREGQLFDGPILIVTAHPDDETLGLGGALSLLPRASVLQITDGGHVDPRMWARVGATSRAEYAALRCTERAAAMVAGGWVVAFTDLNLPDQGAHAAAARVLTAVMAAAVDVDVIVTHPYEGGHPDHDTASWAVQAACDRLGARAPARAEFASYHWNGAQRIAGYFWPTPAGVAAVLTGDRLARKRRALAAYASQASVIRWFPVAQERYRRSPRYDFTARPPVPGIWYERRAFGEWAMWRAALRGAL
jgi:LmbE family N-acetylglucosaminyl deacetylase